MIPEQYWQVARRWFWLIALFGALGAVAGFFVLPSVIGSSAAFDSSATLAVSQYIPAARYITGDGEAADQTLLASYTQSVAGYAATPQFIAAVQQELAKHGYHPSRQTIDQMLTVTATPEDLRIHVEAKADSPAMAESLATAAGNLLIARAIDEQTQLSGRLAANLDQKRAELVARINAIELQQASHPPNPDVLDLESGAVGQELKDLTRQRELLILDQQFSLPVVMVSPPATAPTDGATLSPRDMLLLGILGGLVAGWGAANVAERTRPATPEQAEPTPREARQRASSDGASTSGWRLATPVGTPALDLQLVKLAERAAEIQRRAKTLDKTLSAGRRSHWEEPRPSPAPPR